MDKYIAQGISWIFHPLLMPVLSLFVLLELDSFITYRITDGLRNLLYAILLINTFLMPALSTVFLYKKGVISSLQMREPSERWFPLLVTAFFFFFSYYLLQRLPLSPVIFSMMLGAAISVAITFVVNFFFKISAHMIGVGGLIGAICGISVVLQMSLLHFLMPAILLAGFIGYARLRLNAHQPAEVYSGFLIGFFCVFLAVIYS